MASVSIPVDGTKEYRMAVNAFAQENGTNMAKIVREALDEKLGKSPRFLEMVSFFAPDGQKINQLEEIKTTHG